MFEAEVHSPKKLIVFMSDGGDYINDSVLDKAKNAGIKIITIGFGNWADESVLKHIANYTGGEYYKAVTADDLVDIYDKIGTDQYLDLTDTDGDGLADIFEQSGMRVQNGQIIHTNYQKSDTDNDGLEDGEEIKPIYKKKRIPQSITGTEQIVGITFVMNSNPEDNDDTDGDGYCDIEDPEPNQKPEILGDKYDFLDNEIYYISGNINYFLDVQNGSTVDGTSVIIHSYNGNDSQKFKFEWCDTGYKIHELKNPNLVLTMETNVNGDYDICMKIDRNEQKQIWEVLPYDTNLNDFENYYGLVIRSKVLNYENNDTVGRPLYLNYTTNGVSVTSDRDNYTKFSFENIAEWSRFGSIYMQYSGWIYNYHNNYNTLRAMKNYRYNMNLGLINSTNDDSNIFKYNNYELVINQYGGNMQNQNGSSNISDNKNKLKFADVHMGHAACELMATYNGMKLADLIPNDGCKKSFFALAVEFEINNIYITNSGYLGSNPAKIANCLDSYNANYCKADSVDTIDNSLFNDANVKSTIVSYKFNSTSKYLLKFKLHSYVAVNDGRSTKYPLFTVNRGSNHNYTQSYDRKTINDIEKDSGGMNAYYVPNQKYIQDTRAYDVGYILY